ncbi:hypothetical protein KOR42_51570 [Thalassoglobus neptunius]|uniref:Uncharacterized protein n=1 Tax=Thalassoglobus neptunius TaxID=1938619 RepID=A0A5C5VP74_9PLAN|nr:hypothetical protein KOR42_51570 [Thalassoglobus neptunius]
MDVVGKPCLFGRGQSSIPVLQHAGVGIVTGRSPESGKLPGNGCSTTWTREVESTGLKRWGKARFRQQKAGTRRWQDQTSQRDQAAVAGGRTWTSVVRIHHTSQSIWRISSLWVQRASRKSSGWTSRLIVISSTRSGRIGQLFQIIDTPLGCLMVATTVHYLSRSFLLFTLGCRVCAASHRSECRVCC